MELQISIQNTSSPLFLGAKMEENGKQDSTANRMYVNENSMDIEVIHKQEVVVGDQLFYADEELITNNLDKRMTGQLLRYHAIHDVDVFLYHPQQLSQMHLPFRGKEWYFLIPACQKSTEGGQCNSSDSDGYWEPYGTDSLIHKDGKLIGYRKTLNYVEGKHEKDWKRTEWPMHEYTRDRSSDDKQPAHDQGTRVSPHLPQNDQRTASRTSTGPHKANNAVVTDKVPSNCLNFDLHPLAAVSQGLVIPSCSKKKIDGTIASHWREHGPMLPCRPQHGQQKVPPELQYDQQTMAPLSGIHNVNNDEIIVKPPMLNHHHDALDLPSTDQVPKLPSVDCSPHGSHENEAIIALRCGGWPFCTAKRLPPLDGPFQSLTEQELVFFDKPGPEYSQANANKKKRPRND